MAQNNSNNSAGGNNSQPTMGTVTSSDTDVNRTDVNRIAGAGVVTPGDRTNPRFNSAETSSFNEARASYQPQRSQVTVTERRTASRPSTTAVIGSAAAAALVGGAIPFMLSARKSRQTDNLSVQRRDANASYGESEFAEDGSTSRNSR